MTELTQEDTFKKLRQVPFVQMAVLYKAKLFKDRTLRFSRTLNDNKLKEFTNEHGWDMDDFCYRWNEYVAHNY